MIPDRETLINQIYYLAHRHWIRNMDFYWDGRLFRPPNEEEFLKNATVDTLQKIVNKYKESETILFKIADDIIYRRNLRNART